MEERISALSPQSSAVDLKLLLSKSLFFYKMFEDVEPSKQIGENSHVVINKKNRFSYSLTLIHPGFLRYCPSRGGSGQTPPLVSQLWDPKNSKTQFSQTDMVLSFHLSS